MNFHERVEYKNEKGFVYPGYIIARTIPAESPTPAFLVAFVKPKRIKGEPEEEYKKRLADFAETFECNPEHLGPCVNRVITETELITENYKIITED